MPSVPRAERIEALDVIRGFALIGILMMNIEYFNRPSADLGMGIGLGQTGASLWFSYFVMYFVTGKFWTMFSLLFGMGFGVMLMRAESAQRSFLGPYMRRIAALAVFGALHHIFLWSGDILFSYAVAATALLIILYGHGKYILLTIVALLGLSFIPQLDWTRGIAFGIIFFGACAWYLRAPERVTLFKFDIALFKIIIGVIMIAAIGVIAASFIVPGLGHEEKLAMPIAGTAFLILALLMARFHNPAELRARRMAVGIFIFQAVMATSMGAADYFAPDPVRVAALKQEQAEAAVAATLPPVTKPVATVPAKVISKDAPKKPLSDAEKAAEAKKERVERMAKRKAKRDNEVRVLTKGSYAEAVAMRSQNFFTRAPGQVGFATILIAMFLLGMWFVRSGIMANTKEHLPLFRKLAFIALPFGIGLGLVGSQIATHAIPGTPNGWGFASGLLMLGSLPACLGYVGMVVLMLNSRLFAGVKVLAPFGRMALTNYLTHSLVFSLVFFGYGLGYFGTLRIWQLACVIAMVLVQIPLSHLWLTHFRYGPMEWVWRAITYWQLPAMRVAPVGRALGMPRPV